MVTIEDKVSYDLYRERVSTGPTPNRHRQLKHKHHGKHHGKHHRKKHHGEGKDRVDRAHYHHLKIHDGTQHGMMIDAGSQGTRIHIYEFEARILSTKRETEDAVSGRKLSIPTTDTRWTNRLRPGLDTFAFIEDDAQMIQMISQYLSPLLEFAKRVLVGKKSHWGHYPIYLKATGGLRALPRPYRIRLITAIRTILQDTSFNPFYFEQEYVILMGTRIAAICFFVS
jgi:GDA1/CD39 (nucleoside phosphatase) family